MDGIEDLESLRFAVESLGKNQRKVLGVLIRYPGHGMFGSEIGRRTSLKASTLSGTYKSLEARGLIERAYPTQPPFSVFVFLTPLAISYFNTEVK